ncbi:MAG: hypothetical protein ACLPYS_18725 [Vulcanimicrobiaceae bacterium]
MLVVPFFGTPVAAQTRAATLVLVRIEAKRALGRAKAHEANALADAVKRAGHDAAPLTFSAKKDGVFRTVSIDYHGGLHYPHLERVAGTPTASARCSRRKRAR